MNNVCTTGAALLLAITLLAPAAFADVQLDYASPNSEQTTSHIAVHEGHVRIADTSDTVMLYNAAKHQFLILDTANKTYHVINRQTVAKLRAMVSKARQLLSILPPSLQDTIRQHAPGVNALINAKQPLVTLAAGSKPRTIGSYQCRIITVNIRLNGGMIGNLCVSPAAALDMPKEDAKTLVTMMTDMLQFGGEYLRLRPKAFTALIKHSGIPIRYTAISQGQALVLHDISHAEMKDKKMTLPPNYRRQSLIGLFGVRQERPD